jgi:phospho-N-acetylmuramoyl-pentapeptide-transferase
LILAALVSIAAGSTVIKILTRLKVRQTISSDAPARHLGKQGTPTMGGVIIFIGMVIGLIIGLAVFPLLSARDLGAQRLWPVLFLVLVSACIGFVDDYLIATRGKNLGLKARQKLAVQFAAAIIFIAWVCAGRPFATNVLWAGEWRHFGWIYYPLAVLMIVGMSNAVNLADGLDGLCAGLTAEVLLTMGVLLAVVTPGLTVLAWSVAGGSLGFLWYNRNPARVFMGDTGSLALGAAVAGIGIVGRQEILTLAIGAVFVMEALSVIIQVVSFKTTGKRVFKMTPIHHHFELSGWPERTIVKRFWIVQAVICVVVLVLAGVFRI